MNMPGFSAERALDVVPARSFATLSVSPADRSLIITASLCDCEQVGDQCDSRCSRYRPGSYAWGQCEASCFRQQCGPHYTCY